jgi:hypothetical protein
MATTDLNSEFQPIRFVDLQTYTLDPADYITGTGFVRRGACLLLSGYTGIGKSTLSTQLGICCAAGISFLGISVPKPVKVLIVQAENDKQTLKRDVLSIANYLNVDEKVLNDNLIIRHVWATEEFFTALRIFIEFEKPDVLIIDPYQAYVLTDTNSSVTSAAFSSGLNRISHDYNIGVVLVAHFSKQKDIKAANPRQSVYSVAGHSALSNWARTSMEIYPTRDDRRYNLTFGKNAERTGLKDPDGHILRNIFIEHSGCSNNPYWILSANQSKEQSDKKPSKKKSSHAEIQRLHEEHPDWTCQQIGDKVGCNKSTVSRALGQ